MVREIKFRAWLRLENKMAIVDMIKTPRFHYPYVISWHKDGKGNIGYDQSMYDFENRNSNVILMEYIGIRDKNGVEIYEGDIVTAFGEDWEVKWSLNDSAYRLVRERETKSIGKAHAQDYEVKGNIFELVSDNE